MPPSRGSRSVATRLPCCGRSAITGRRRCSTRTMVGAVMARPAPTAAKCDSPIGSTWTGSSARIHHTERDGVSIPAVNGRCSECGFDYEEFEAQQLPAQLETLHGSFDSRIVAVSDEALRRRPEPDVWSILEYTCHVRDVLRIQHERLQRSLRENRPVCPRSGMWQWPERDAYNSQSP